MKECKKWLHVIWNQILTPNKAYFSQEFLHCLKSNCQNSKTNKCSLRRRLVTASVSLPAFPWGLVSPQQGSQLQALHWRHADVALKSALWLPWRSQIHSFIHSLRLSSCQTERFVIGSRRRETSWSVCRPPCWNPSSLQSCNFELQFHILDQLIISSCLSDAPSCFFLGGGLFSSISPN